MWTKKSALKKTLLALAMLITLTCGLVLSKLILRYRRIPENEPPSSEAIARIVFSGKSHQIQPEFLSFAVDMSQWLGYKWWGPSGKSEFIIGGDNPPELNLNDPGLKNLLTQLRPFYLRLGGSLADEVSWDFGSESAEIKPGVIREHHRRNLQFFLKSYQAKLIFNVSSNPHLWQGLSPDNQYYDPVFSWLEGLGTDLYSVEFGNESGIHPLLHGTYPEFKTYGQRLIALQKRFKKMKVIWSGPGNPFWPYFGEWFSFLFSPTENYLIGSKEGLDTASFHYYPTQSSRCGLRISPSNEKYFLSTRHLNEFENAVLDMKNTLSSLGLKIPLWLSESGPAQCGGQLGFSDRFVSSLWWTDELGLAAKNDVQLVIRQSLLGGDYGLIDEKTLKPRPDFWISVLWKKTMGDLVLDSRIQGNSLRAYTHCQNDRSLNIAVINIEDISQKIELPEKEFKIFEVTADSLQSSQIKVNQREILDQLPDANLISLTNYSVKPHSLVFMKTRFPSKFCFLNP